MTDDEDEELPARKSKQPPTKARPSRKSANDIENSPSYASEDGKDILGSNKLEKIVDVRRNKRTETVEYQIQLKKGKKPAWISADELAEAYSQEIVDFLQEKYVE